MALPTRPNFNSAELGESRGLPTRPSLTPMPSAPLTGGDESLSAPVTHETAQMEQDDPVALLAAQNEPEALPAPHPDASTIWDEEPAEDDASATPSVDEDFEEELEDLPKEVQDAVEALMEEILSDDSSEITMNGPNSIHCKRRGRRVHLTQIKFSNNEVYKKVIDRFILEYTSTKERISTSSTSMIEGQLNLFDPTSPDRPAMVARIHVVFGTASKYPIVTIAKKARRQMSLDDIYSNGAMSANMYEFLRVIAQGKLTTIISGQTGAGKTTLMEAMSYHFDQEDRIVVVEDTPELNFPVGESVYLLSSKPRPGEALGIKTVSLEWLVAQANRMRADRIIVGETRGEEMAEFLIAANSGADGSMTTIHAHDPERAVEKMTRLASKASGNQSDLSIARDIASTVHIIVQASLIEGQHIITHIAEVSNVVSQASNKIALNPIFTYDRRRKNWEAVGRPSEELREFLDGRGVSVQNTWFQR